MSDVLVIGGGVIGLSIAYELSGRGVSVTVVDQGLPGREASWAGAGMLPPAAASPTAKPILRLRSASHLMWPQLSESLRCETGIDNGYRRCGALEVRCSGPADELFDDAESDRQMGAEVESLSPAEARELEPHLTEAVTAAYRLPEMAQVRNPWHLKALLAACLGRGVQLVTGTPVHGFARREGNIVGVETNAGVLNAGQFVVSAGAWSQRVLESAGCRVAVQPARGQIVLLNACPLPFRHIVMVGKKYMVPRPDGRVLVGSTVERVGFNKQNTAAGINGLLDFAASVVPCLAEAQFESAWAGLRPRSRDGLPYLGRVPETENVWVATGHFRDGLQLSPITGILMAELILGNTPSLPLEAFACNRHRSTADAGRRE